MTYQTPEVQIFDPPTPISRPCPRELHIAVTFLSDRSNAVVGIKAMR